MSRAIRAWVEAEWFSEPSERYRAREALFAALSPDLFATLAEFYDFLDDLSVRGARERSAIDEMCSMLREQLPDRSRSPGRFVRTSVPLSAPFPDRAFDHWIGGPERIRVLNDDPGNAIMMRCTVPAHEALVRSESTLQQLVGSLFAIELAQWHPSRHPTYMHLGTQKGVNGVFSRDIALRASKIETMEEDPGEIGLSGTLLSAEYSDIIPHVYFPELGEEFERDLVPEEPHSGGVLGCEQLRILRSVFTRSNHSGPLRTAAGILFRAIVTDDLGWAVMLSVLSIESLLLGETRNDGSDQGRVTARIQEAVAFLLGRSPQERTELRRTVKKMYDLRSKFAHVGRFDGPREGAFQARELARRVLAHEMRVLASGPPRLEIAR